MSACLVVTTIDSQEAAQKLGRGLVEENLAACVQITPIVSIYRWEGAIERTNEWRLDIKARREQWPQLEAALRARHSYKTPEILRFDVDAGSADYLAWLAKA